VADDQDILTVKELCELLRIHPSTLYKLLRQGKIPSFRVGNEWRFRKDAITRWLSEKSEGAGKVRKVIDIGGDGKVRGPKR
jgi:excisionase family DNA binding protein